MIMDIKDTIKKDTELIENALRAYLPEMNNEQSIIYDAMRYSLLAGGKRLRPMLMIEVGRMCGGNADELMPMACAMEMIHTYSLIHDDLPAMDDDDLRRGRPTNHIEFGEAIAILAGDALLNKAFEIMLAGEYSNRERALKAMSVISKSSGTEGMIGGQIIDINSENKKISIEELKHLHLLKTGAIIRSSCAAGAIMAGADDDGIKAIDEFAKNLGVAFQIRDDILDVEGDELYLGKPIGSDEEQNKNTYVTIEGLEKSKELCAIYSERAKSALDIFADKADFLKALTDMLVGRNN